MSFSKVLLLGSSSSFPSHSALITRSEAFTAKKTRLKGGGDGGSDERNLACLCVSVYPPTPILVEFPLSAPRASIYTTCPCCIFTKVADVVPRENYGRRDFVL